MKRVERFEVGKRYRWVGRGGGTAEFLVVGAKNGGAHAVDAEECEWRIGYGGDFFELPVALRVQSASGSLPRYATPGSSGLDLESALYVELPPHSRAIIPTGLSLEIPAGYEGQIRPRSGLTAKTSLTVHLGTIDSDYRGEVGVIAENCGPAPYSITRGQRIAQLVIAPVARVEVVRVEQLGSTERGGGGFGSTGG